MPDKSHLAVFGIDLIEIMHEFVEAGLILFFCATIKLASEEA